MKVCVLAPEPHEVMPWSFDASSPGRRRALELARRVAPSSCSVLILGPTGVGKEVLAEDIHRHSPQADGPFVSVNCAAITPSLFESEFFGHIRGSFTGAVSDKVGLVELADGGVLFLDEVGELPLGAQAKLLRFLAKGTYWPVGSTRERRSTVRVIAATHRRIDETLGDDFREDLFYRLSVVTIRIPPLELEDIRVVVRSIAVEVMVRLGISVTAAHVEQLADLCSMQRWRGGVRELRNILERFHVLYDPTLSIDDNWAGLFGSDEVATQSGVRPTELKVSVMRQLDNLIFLGIARECSDVRDLAHRVGRTTQAVYNRLKKLGLSADDVGATPALMQTFRQLQQGLQPNLHWIHALFSG